MNFFDLASYDSEIRKRYTLRLLLMCLKEWNFPGGMETNVQMIHLGKGFPGEGWDWRKLCKLTGKWASSKTVSKDSANTSCSLPTGCFSDTIYWVTLQKMHISEYVSKTCLKELTINMANPWKILQPYNIVFLEETFLKILLFLFFCRIRKTSIS